MRSAAGVDTDLGYLPRHPEETILYGVVAEQLETFLSRQQHRERPVPGFVEREFRSFLECGIAECGFLRLHGDSCGKDRILPFSCKRRALCPSCGGRRMAATAAHLVDCVIPDVPVRQWVLSLPFALRYRVAFDTALLGNVLEIFVRAVFGFLRQRARDSGIPQGKCGAVAFIQRFGSALNLNPHVHLLVFDGIYAAEDGERPTFYPLRPPEKGEVAAVVTRVAMRVATLLESQDSDSEEQDESGLASLYSTSIQGRIASGPNAGQRVKTVGNDAVEESLEPGGSRSAMVAGFSMHAGVAIRAGDRLRLEKLCKYMARPPLANERLSRLSDGRLTYRLKTPWRNGTTHVIFEPLELLEKLAVLVPAPRANLIHFFGVVAPASKWRSSIVPASVDTDAAVPKCDCEETGETKKRRRLNYGWAQLMARVFELDVLECPHCKGRLRILAVIHPPVATRKILDCLGLPTRGPPLQPAIPTTIPEYL